MILDMEFQTLLADVQSAASVNKATAYLAIKAVFNRPELVRELSLQNRPLAYIDAAIAKGW